MWTAVFLDFNLTIGHFGRAKRTYKIGRRRQLLRRRSARSGEKRLFGQKVTSWQWANPKIQKASTATHLLGEKDTLELKRQRAKPSKGILPIKWPKEKGRNYKQKYPRQTFIKRYEKLCRTITAVYYGPCKTTSVRIVDTSDWFRYRHALRQKLKEQYYTIIVFHATFVKCFSILFFLFIIVVTM